MQEYLTRLLRQMKGLGATELFLTKGKPPTYRINGCITNTEGEALTHTRIALVAHAIMPEDLALGFEENREANVSFVHPSIGRFRVNFFKQRSETALVIRALPDQVPVFDDLGIPQIFKKICLQKKGIILIAGPSGMGKSTTLASLLDYRNEHTASHIVTIEDPIEYVLEHKQSIISQREIGTDTRSVHTAFENALRQSPDVLAIGEIRSREAMEYALNFADTGRLCIATLNANNATQALERIISLFPEENRDQLQISLASHIKAILAQQLVPNKDGLRIPIYEHILTTPRMADIISRGEFDTLRETMEKDDTTGIQSMDQSLYNLYQQSKITAETAMEYASSYRNMRLRMRLSTAGKTVSTP